MHEQEKAAVAAWIADELVRLVEVADQEDLAELAFLLTMAIEVARVSAGRAGE